MEQQSIDKLNRIWNQPTIPVIFRQGGKKDLLVRLPYSTDNRVWIKLGHRVNPVWDKEKKHWIIPRSWFNDLVNKCLERYNKVYVIQPYRVQEKCAPACWNAKGHECNCSCMGANHGTQGANSGWLVISEAFATRWETSDFACRLLTKQSDS